MPDLIDRRLLALCRSGRRLLRFTRCEILAAIERSGPRGQIALEFLAGKVQVPVSQVASTFERRTGDRVRLSFNQVGKVRRAFASGVPADIVILSAPVLHEFERKGAIVHGSAVALGETSIGVGVLLGAPLPDI
jgi:ABC-type molybdate transport system substrate-binding protein